MKQKHFIAVLFLMLAGMHTTQAQTMSVNLADGTKLVYGVSEVESVTFSDDEGAIAGRAYVDLGLPSGTLWATCNVGARSPEEKGTYFAWGETEPKLIYDWLHYKYINPYTEEVTKYKLTAEVVSLAPDDDAATICWGGEWRSPDQAQMDELIANTTHTWQKQDGVYGYMFKSKVNENSIFLPTTGLYISDRLSGLQECLYWSNMLAPTDEKAGLYMSLAPQNGELTTRAAYRFYGLNIRPVRKSTQPEHEYVDLALPSGTLWATCNIGAEVPEDYGDYFAWGETSPKTEFSWDNYLLGTGSTAGDMTSYNATDGLTELMPEDDAATANWGSQWQMPSKEQFEELLNENNTTIVKTASGRMITSKVNHESIFLPNSGDYGFNGLEGTGSYGSYWSRTRNATNALNAHLLLSQSSNIISTYGYRFAGKPVRPVRKQ